jgi:hypothetical protein
MENGGSACSGAAGGDAAVRAAREIEMEDREIRDALERHWTASDANDFVVEQEIYREDALLYYPQSGERRGRHNIQESRTVQPSKKRFHHPADHRRRRSVGHRIGAQL